jgi:hypothetical protein
MKTSSRRKFAWAVLVAVLCIMCGIGKLLLDFMFPHPPIMLTLLGYTSVSNGVPIARFSMSNHSGQPVEYLSDGPSTPHYYLMRLLSHNTNSGAMVFTNYHRAVSVATANSIIPPGGKVTFAVPMVAGTTNITVGVHYFPKHPAMRALVREVKILLTGGYSEGYENAYLCAPFN